MSTKRLATIFFLTLILLSACQAAAPETIVETVVVAAAVEAETVERIVEMEEPVIGPFPAATAAAFNAGGQAALAYPAFRMIIKDGQIKLLVEQTDLAIDLLTQAVVDTGGYIISSRIWFEEWGGEPYKYASFSVGVPVERFETTLSRLRGLAVQVLDESASGEDVTDQYVDLESRLDNLKATRDRIRTFLDQAQKVEEALAVNEQLADVEAEIEVIQGRLNYLADRAAFSTIQIILEPVLPPLPSPSPTPLPTPAPWSARENFRNANRTLGDAYKAIINIGIWIFVVVLPVAGPPVLLAWAGWRFWRRRGVMVRRRHHHNERAK